MPGYDEIADIDVINGNMDKIDVQMKKNADSAQQSKDIVSDEYSATNMYAVGDYCIHENVLYKCKTAITTGEAFDSSKWVQTTCGTEFVGLNSNLDTLEFGEVAGGKNLVNIIDYESKAENNYTYKFIPYKFELGKKYTISGNCERVSGVTNKLLTITLYNSLGSVSNSQASDVSFASGKFSKTFTINENNINANSILIYTGTAGATLGNDYKFSNIQLEEGTQATDYEPYIPSVKMLADEVSAQKNDLGGLSFSVSGTTLSITDGTNTWTFSQ